MLFDAHSRLNTKWHLTDFTDFTDFLQTSIRK